MVQPPAVRKDRALDDKEPTLKLSLLENCRGRRGFIVDHAAARGSRTRCTRRKFSPRCRDKRNGAKVEPQLVLDESTITAYCELTYFNIAKVSFLWSQFFNLPDLCWKLPQIEQFFARRPQVQILRLPKRLRCLSTSPQPIRDGFEVKRYSSKVDPLRPYPPI